MKTKEFKVGMNPAVLYFEIFYVVYIVWRAIVGDYQSALVAGIAGILILGYLLLYRPYKYSIDRKDLIIHRRIGKNKEINLMTCETICNPVPKMTKIITNPRSLEIYTEGKKRIVVTPKERIKFVEAIVAANKRIHIQVEEYAATHRSYEKKRRKEMKKEKVSEYKNDKKNIKDAE